MAFLSEGACRDAPEDAFFPGDYTPDYKKDDFDAAESEAVAELRTQYCSVCPVFEECYQHALTHHEPTGIWAGLTTHQRTELRRGI